MYKADGAVVTHTRSIQFFEDENNVARIQEFEALSI